MPDQVTLPVPSPLDRKNTPVTASAMAAMRHKDFFSWKNIIMISVVSTGYMK